MSRFGERTRASTQVSAWLPRGVFLPFNLSPALWLDASDTATITSSSGAVSQWSDKSGNGRHVTQATALNQPTTGSATQNSLNVLSFDGTNDSLYRSATFDLGTTYTIALVATPSTGTDDYVFHLNRAASVTGQSAIISKFLSRSYESYNDLTTPATNARFTLGSSSLAGYNTLVVVRNGATMTSLVNGIASNGGTFTTTNVIFDGVFVGSSNSGNNFNGQIAEIVVYSSALSGNDLANASDYLRTKWATP